MNKKIMILGASILQLPAIKKAKELRLEIVVVDMNPNAIGFKEEGIKKEIISTIDVPKIIEAAKKHKIDGIMTLATDMPMRAVAAVSKELGIIGISEDTAIKATNKINMRDALRTNKVPIPKYYKVSSEDEYQKIVGNFSVPFIVKPADNSGSRGIFEVLDITDSSLIKEAYEYSHQNSRCGDVIVEEYMEGPEVSVETLAIDGQCYVIQITDKLTTGAPHYVEMGHSQPTKLEKNIVDEIIYVAKKANQAIGIKNGPSHTEIIVTKEGPKVVEIGARLGGDNITTHLVPLSTGIDMVESCIKIALGESPDIQKKWIKGSAIRYFKQTKGIIKSINGVEQAQNFPGVKQISIVHDVGKFISDVDSSAARMGFVIAQGENVDEAIKTCTRALEKIKVEIGAE